ncbi:hypothetical protein J1N35_029611 [Gossypium stocksii]|uniref:DUF4216 domain-containing protein n=1 Tax=Gossypium stocksii TaxID=47602 RepID=A0A9D3V0D1_9ROSI|nr:hypothetical protein J1N35_029611 [Gossypium stocksii]
MEGMLRDAFNMRSDGLQSFPPNYVVSDDYNIGGNTFMETGRSVSDEQPNEEAAKFYTLLGEMNEEHYEGSKFLKMSFCPNRLVKRYSVFIINGFRFHTKYRERLRRAQNCGIVVNSSITSYASARDSNPVEGNMEYYGPLTDIIELDYYGKWKVVLFRGDWADVNTARVKQVFYSKDPTDEGWYVVLRNSPRDLFDMGDGRKMVRRKLRDLTIVQNNPNSEEGNSEQQTIVGSSTESVGTRRGRGRTLLTNLYDLAPTERVKVRRNNHSQLVGSEARVFAGYLGILARNANMLLINYESWHHMPDSNKNQALDNIKERFVLEVSDDYIKKTLGKKWRDNKSTLKKKFKKDISLEEKLRNVPPGMLRYQWEDTVRFWNSKKGELEQVADRNKNSRTWQGREVLLEVSSGQKVGRLQLFDITHRKKDGSPMTSKAGEIMERLKEKKAKYEVISSTDSFVNHEDIDNRIITEVLGLERYDQVRFQISGVTPTQYFESSSQQYMPSGSQAQAEVQRLKDQIAQMQASTVEQIAKVQRKYEKLQQQLIANVVEREAAAAAREAEQSRKYDELQLQLQQMMKMFQQSQQPPS